MRRSAAPHALAAMLVLAGFAGASAAAPPSDEALVVTAVQGDVRVTIDGRAHHVKPGSVIKPPATIHTGRDGAIELRQGGTRATVSPDTQVEIPAVPLRGKFVDRLVQPRGNVFYDVAPRSANKLRVETPYLVAVIKGTQFNVAAHPESATVSLFEGRLEVWTPEGSDVVQLNAGEIATRARGEARIRVLDLSSGETLRARAAPHEAGGQSRSRAANDALADPAPVPELVATVDPVRDRSPLAPVADLRGDLLTSDRVDTKIDLGTDSVATDTAAGVDLGIAEIGATVGTGVDLDAGTVEAAAGLDAGLAGIDAGVDASAAVDLGTGTVDLGADAVVADTPVAVDAGVDLGGAPAIEASVDLGALDVDLGVDLGAPEPETTVTDPDPVEDVVEDIVAPLRGLLGR